MTEFNEIDMFDKLSEEKFNYLLENKIDLIDLAHEDLPDEWLLDLYVDCGKRKQLIDLCIKSDFAHEYLCRFRGHWISDNVSNMTNPEEIFKVYNSNSKEELFCLKLQEIFIPLKNCLLNLQIQRMFYLQNK